MIKKIRIPSRVIISPGFSLEIVDYTFMYERVLHCICKFDHRAFTILHLINCSFSVELPEPVFVNVYRAQESIPRN
jgi:hypothetical protein